jgi:hypothetical protein
MESTRLIFADSRSRDVRLYPSGNSYTLHLTTPIKNVTRVDLVSARVPNTMYNLTVGSNVLAIGAGSSNLISLNSGFYSAGGLASAMSAAVNNAFSMNYLSNEGRFILSNAKSFAFRINSSELSTLMGIPQTTLFTSKLATSLDPCYSGMHIFKSNTMIHMNANEYIFLDVDELKTPSHIDTKALSGTTGTVSGSNINRAFAPIMMDVSSGGMKIYHENADYTVSVAYPEPINSLQRLTVNWYDTNGRRLNFMGSDNHAFILRAHVLEDDVRRLPPPPPLQDVEIKRIVEAMTMVPPPPPEKKTKIPWLIIFLVLIATFAAWKTLSGQSLRTQAAGAPGSSR